MSHPSLRSPRQTPFILQLHHQGKACLEVSFSRAINCGSMQTIAPILGYAPPPAAPSHPPYEQEMAHPPPPQHPQHPYASPYGMYAYAHPRNSLMYHRARGDMLNETSFRFPERGAPPQAMGVPAQRGPTSPQAFYPPGAIGFVPIPAPLPPIAQPKRASESLDEDQPGPKAKKARATKAKAPETSGRSPFSPIVVTAV